MATIAIGDVHGNIAALDDLLRQLKSEVRPGDVVVFLGGLHRRGPRTKECVERILGLQHEMPGAVECLCGNHDDWFLRTLHGSRQHTWLLATDAFKTIESYSVDAAHVLRAAASRRALRSMATTARSPTRCSSTQCPSSISVLRESAPLLSGPDCVCARGLDPGVASVHEQTRHALIWGAGGFPTGTMV